MPSGYPHSRLVRREFFDLVCCGAPVRRAAQALGVSTTRASIWWRDAGAMELIAGSGARGLARPGDVTGPGGRGHRLSFDERIEIMRGLDAGLSPAEIGRGIGRHRSVVCREIARNRNPDGDYHARMAHARAARNARRPKAFKLVDHPLCAAIEGWMDDGWSPKLIAEMLARDHPDDKLARVSHETIYQCLYVQTRGTLRADLHKRLSTKRAHRKPRGRTDNRRGAYSSGEEFKISDRPPEVADRAVPGHWEGDLILGPNNTAIGTLVERATRFVLLLHLPGDHTAETVATAMIQTMGELPDICDAPLPGIAAARWPTGVTSTYSWAPRSTSATPTPHGSAAAMRTPTACCDSGSKREATSAVTPKPTSNTSKTHSTADPGPH